MGVRKSESTIEVIGGICTAALSSICCWGPLVLGLLGIGILGIGTINFLARFRWLFIILAALFLGRALYLAYRSQKKGNIFLLWGIIFLAGFLILFPYLRLFLGI